VRQLLEPLVVGASESERGRLFEGAAALEPCLEPGAGEGLTALARRRSSSSLSMWHENVK
jgi:hypothetical protein